MFWVNLCCLSLPSLSPWPPLPPFAWLLLPLTLHLLILLVYVPSPLPPMGCHIFFPSQ